MVKREFQYPSSDQKTTISAVEWIPEGRVRAVLQICHGMVEYIDRYDEFASYLSEQGFYVTGHDHLGHGKSIQSKEHLGFFHETRGNEFVISDIHKLHLITAEKYPEVPYFIMGHSMGSFLVRQYLIEHAEGIDGAVLMGTGYQGALVLNAGQLLCRIIAMSKGWKYRSPFVNKLGMGGMNKKFEPSDTGKDWVTSDGLMLEAYVKDPLCSFMFTVNGYYNLFAGMKKIIKKKNLEKMPADLPVLFVSGADDPVGGEGKGVRKVYQDFKRAGISDVNLKLYDGARHEILNDRHREAVCHDLFIWLESKMKDK